MKELTPAQRKIFEFIRDFISQHHYPPTHRQIMVHCGYKNTRSVFDHLAALQKKGYIKKAAHGARALELTGPPAYEDHVALVGAIAAGIPITAEENIDELLQLKAIIPRDDGQFLLRIQGDSMKDAAIHHNDLALIRPQPVPDYQGQVVAVRIDNDATLKYCYRRNERIELRPANEAYEPIVYRPEDGLQIAIIGVLERIIRYY